jgi:hypothetical protein
MEKLFRILNIIGGTYSTDNYNLGWKVLDIVSENPDSVISFENKMEWRNYDIHNYDHWITYLEGRPLKFYIKENELYVKVKVCDLGIMGDRYDVLWSADIKLPIDFLKNIENELQQEFYKFCESAYIQYLRTEKEMWIREFAEKILG